MSVKYTINTEIVKLFILFLAIPVALRDEECKTRIQFMAKHGIKSVATLFNYERIDGFWSAVRKENKKFTQYYNAKVDNSLFESTQGVTGEKSQYNAKTREYEVVTYEIPPNVKAIELHKKINDGYEDTLKLKGDSLLTSIHKRAKQMREEKAKVVIKKRGKK